MATGIDYSPFRGVLADRSRSGCPVRRMGSLRRLHHACIRRYLLFLEVVRYYAVVKLCGMCLIRGCLVTFSRLVDCCVCVGYLLLSCSFVLLYPIRTVHTVPTSV